jgi:hypothetical protein
MLVGLFVLAVLDIPLISTSALAQVQAERTTAVLVLAEGAVYLNDTLVDVTAAPSVLADVAVLRTVQGRAAIALKRGGWLFLDADSSVRVSANGSYNFNRLDVLSGSAIVSSGTSAPLIGCGNEIRVSSGGLFRFDSQPATAGSERPCRFRVYDGAAAVSLVTVTTALRAGQSMTCNRRCGDMIPATEFSPTQLDGFDQWAQRVQQQLRQ